MSKNLTYLPAARILLFFFPMLLSISFASAQAPGITYNSNHTYFTGISIPALSPVNTGGAATSSFMGRVTTLAGKNGVEGSVNGTDTAARFSFPIGAATDAAGNIYISDPGNNLIRKITPFGVVSTLAGKAGVSGSKDSTGSGATFNTPLGVAADASGNIYVADIATNLIRKISPAGVVTTLAGKVGIQGSTDGRDTAATFKYPMGLAVDSKNNLIVSDFGNFTIRKISPAGEVSTLAGTTGVRGSADGQGTAASFSNPTGLAVDASDNIYVSDTQNQTIRKISPQGIVTTFAGKAGKSGLTDSTGTAARFNYPLGITVDASGTVYVTDIGNNLIRMISQAGKVTTLAGNSGDRGSVDGIGQAAGFYGPIGIAVDASGNIYVADAGSKLIRKITTGAYSIIPTLPAGLVFNDTTGIISGKPSGVSPVTAYTVTAYNAFGSNTTTFNITVLAAAPPTVTTLSASAIKSAGATISGTSTDGNAATTVSFQYSTSDDLSGALKATISSGTSPMSPGTGQATFTSMLGGLASGTTYFYRITATNIAGTSNGAILSFRTQSTDANLTDLTLGSTGMNQVFSSSVTAYAAVIPNMQSSVSLDLIPEFSLATATVNGISLTAGMPAQFQLQEGDNQLLVTVTAEDGITQKSYTVSIHRKLALAEMVATNLLSPNGDGMNDTWVVRDILYYPHNTVTVYDQMGRVVFSKSGYTNDWAGTLHGALLNEDTYYYLVDYGPGERKTKGFFTLVRGH